MPKISNEDAKLFDNPYKIGLVAMQDDDEDTLAARVLVEEHKLYPRAIELCCKGKLKVEGRHVRILE